MKRVVVFSGAGISAESGIKTFRDSGGLWENYAIEDVATPGAWNKNQDLVLDFYNQRRQQVMDAKPNPAHLALVELEKHFEVFIITQNIDNLHERAGSTNVLHLHGEIMKARSTVNPQLIYSLEKAEIKKGDCCELGSQLRPHIVWFGEMVPNMEPAIEISQTADVFLVIGTSLAVYPAASLLEFAPENAMKVLVDPNAAHQNIRKDFSVINESAGVGVPQIIEKLIKTYV